MSLALIGLFLLVVAGGLFLLRRRTLRKVKLIERAVPSHAASIKDAFPGECVLLNGISRGNEQLMSEHSETPCVYFKSIIEHEYERRRSTRGRSRRSRRSETVHSLERSVPFTVEDETGWATVFPDGAEFDAFESLNRFEPAEGNQGRFSIGGFEITIGSRDRSLGYRYIEHTIPADSQVLVVGVADENGAIRRSNSGGANTGFLISYRDPESLMSHLKSRSRRYTYGSIGAGIAGIVLLVFVLTNTFL